MHEGSPGHGPSRGPAHPVKPSRVRLRWLLGTGWVGTCSGLSCNFSSYLSVPHLHAEFAVLTHCLPCDQTLPQNKRLPSDRFRPTALAAGFQRGLSCPQEPVHTPFSKRMGWPHDFSAGQAISRDRLFFSGLLASEGFELPFLQGGRLCLGLGTAPGPANKGPAGLRCAFIQPCSASVASTVSSSVRRVLGREGGNGGGGKLPLESQSLGFKSPLCRLPAL